MSVAARVWVLGIVALLAGAGIVYAPAPTFAAVAIVFTLGLWTFTRGGFAYPTKPEVLRGAGEAGKPRSTLTTKLVSGYLLLWWLALIAPLLAYSPREGSSIDAAQGAAQGSLLNQVLVVSFGLVGALFLPTAIKRLDPAFRWVVALWALYLSWAFVSLLWSIYPLLTLRGVVAFALMSVGSFGLGAGFYGRLPGGRDLFLRHVFAAGVLAALVVLAPLPFRWGQYDLLNPSGRLEIGGDFSTYAARPAMCALLVLVATVVLGVRRWQRRDWLWIALLVLPLLALKTRGPALWAVLALCIFYLSFRGRVRDRMLQAGLLVVGGLGAYVAYFTHLFEPIAPYLTRGDVEQTTALTGRVPLWETLVPEIGQHPWLGAGFAAYFSPDNLYRVEHLAGFSATSAHNGFLQELLGTGLVGLAILLTFFFHTMLVVKRRARLGDPLGWIALLFLVYYLLLNLTNALMQDYLQLPFVVILGLLALMAGKPEANPSASLEASGAVRESGSPPRRSPHLVGIYRRDRTNP